MRIYGRWEIPSPPPAPQLQSVRLELTLDECVAYCREYCAMYKLLDGGQGVALETMSKIFYRLPERNSLGETIYTIYLEKMK